MIRTADALEARLKAGALIRETRVHEPEDKSIWNDAETGEVVHATAVRMVRQKGLLRAMADGLFGEAQTYAYAEPEA